MFYLHRDLNLVFREENLKTESHRPRRRRNYDLKIVKFAVFILLRFSRPPLRSTVCAVFITNFVLFTLKTAREVAVPSVFSFIAQTVGFASFSSARFAKFIESIKNERKKNVKKKICFFFFNIFRQATNDEGSLR